MSIYEDSGLLYSLDQLQFEEGQLGEGAFGVVHKAKLKMSASESVTVAIKSLKGSDSVPHITPSHSSLVPPHTITLTPHSTPLSLNLHLTSRTHHRCLIHTGSAIDSNIAYFISEFKMLAHVGRHPNQIFMLILG